MKSVRRPTVKLVLRKSKQRANGEAPVYLRITANRKSRFTATGVYVAPKLWNATKEQIRSSHEIAPALNERLRALRIEAETAALEAISAEQVKEVIAGTGGSLTDYFQRFIDQLEAGGQLWERKKYTTTRNKLTDCLGASLAWDELDRAALVRFERYLREVCENNPNTTRKELSRLGRVVKQAVRDGLVRPDQDPFLIYEKPKGNKPERRKLSLEEIETLRRAVLPEDSWLARARDAFCFAFYAGGMRFGDLASLKVENIFDGRVAYRMMKTGTPVSVPLPPPAQAIAERYAATAKERDGFLFPFLKAGEDADPVRHRRRINSQNVQANKNLKKAAEIAGVDSEGLSFHVARHSFADYARQKSGDLYAVSKTLGHTSLQVTQQYLRSFDNDAVDKLAANLWDK